MLAVLVITFPTIKLALLKVIYLLLISILPVPMGSPFECVDQMLTLGSPEDPQP